MTDATSSALVWQDTNGNGARDEGEGPVSGVVVDLIARSGQSRYRSLTTNAEGLCISASVAR
jgi:hypothetical protein